MSDVYSVDLTVSQGADFSPAAGEALATTDPWIVGGAIQNLTGYTTILKIRTQPTDKSPWLALTSSANANGSVVTPNGTAGTVTININKLDTAALPANLGALTYQLAIVSASPGVETILQAGRIFVIPSGLN